MSKKSMKRGSCYKMGGGLQSAIGSLLHPGQDEEDQMDEDEKLSQGIDAGVGSAIDLVGAFTSGDKYNSKAKAEAIGGTIGAAAGTFLPIPGGTMVGKTVGKFIGGLVGGKKDEQQMAQDVFDRERRQWNQLNIQPNMDKYGNRFEGGGYAAAAETTPAAEPAGPKQKIINVEKGELMIDPITGDIVRKFSNPNRFSPHKDKKMLEPMGNFVSVPEDKVIIPKKLAGRYERGDKLARRSILLQILSDQEENPYHNTHPEEIPEGVQQMAKGGFPGPGDDLLSINPLIERFGLDAIMDNQDVNLRANPDFDPNHTASVTGQAPNVLMATPARMDNDPLVAANLSDASGNPPAVTGNNIDKNKKGKRDLNAVLRQTVNNLPVYAQMANAMKPDPFLAENVNTGYGDAYAYANQLPEKISIAGNLQSNDASFNAASRIIDNNDTPAARAEKAALYSKKLAADNQVYQGQQVANTQLKTTKLGQLMNLSTAKGASDQASGRELMTEQRMDKASRENIVMQGLNNLTDNKLKRENDMAKIKALNDISHFVDIDPYAKKVINEDPEALGYIWKYMSTTDGASMHDALEAYRKDKKKEVTVTTDDKKTTTKTTSTTKAKK